MIDWRTKPEPEPLKPGGRVDDLPDGVREIAEVIGRFQALKLIASMPTYSRSKGDGNRGSLYVPKRLSNDHWLVEILGWHDALRLVNAFPGEILNPGHALKARQATRDQWIFEQAARGITAGKIAEDVGLSVRRVKEIAKETASATGWKTNRWRIKVEPAPEEKSG